MIFPFVLCIVSIVVRNRCNNLLNHEKLPMYQIRPSSALFFRSLLLNQTVFFSKICKYILTEIWYLKKIE